MSTRKKRVVLQTADLTRIRAAAKAVEAREHALIEWLYTNGARASEPGLARIDDVDEWCAGWWAGKTVGYYLGAESVRESIRKALR